MPAVEGEPTATAGFVGRARTGPVGEARLVTQLVDFAQVYGDLEPPDDGPAYLAHAVRAFFLNGGGRLYVSRMAEGDEGVGPALDALARVDEVALVAAPDPGAAATLEACVAAATALVDHAQSHGSRFALVDAPAGSTVDEVREFRRRFDTGHAALYHPWIVPAEGPSRLVLPPSGFVAGVYARSDTERGVLKPPVGDAVQGVAGLESVVDAAAQAVLNPEGVNVLREFERGDVRLWGARTMSSDAELKYVNLRRYFIYLERSIDHGTQWAVFEPNNEALWASVRASVGEFLDGEWRAGHLLGRRPDDAFFVRCDRTTMTQDDVDNGRLVG